MTSQLHDDVKAALAELQDVADDLEQVAGHELVRLYNSLRAASQAIIAAKRGQDVQAPEIQAGAGAIEDPLHPHTAATEAPPQTAADLEAQAAREPDPTVRANVLATEPASGEPAPAASGSADELAGEELDARAAELNIKGRSSMSADEKREAIAKAEQGT
jgi:hypothetical protein